MIKKQDQLRSALFLLMLKGESDDTITERVRSILTEDRPRADARRVELAADKARQDAYRAEAQRKRAEVEAKHPLPDGIYWVARIDFDKFTQAPEQVRVSTGPRGGKRATLLSNGTSMRVTRDSAGRPKAFGYLHSTKAACEAEIEQRQRVWAGAGVASPLAADEKELRRTISENHPDRNPNADTDLYQRAVEQLKVVRGR